VAGNGLCEYAPAASGVLDTTPESTHNDPVELLGFAMNYRFTYPVDDAGVDDITSALETHGLAIVTNVLDDERGTSMTKEDDDDGSDRDGEER